VPAPACATRAGRRLLGVSPRRPRPARLGKVSMGYLSGSVTVGTTPTIICQTTASPVDVSVAGQAVSFGPATVVAGAAPNVSAGTSSAIPVPRSHADGTPDTLYGVTASGSATVTFSAVL
jgi:hypothetical protein